MGEVSVQTDITYYDKRFNYYSKALSQMMDYQRQEGFDKQESDESIQRLTLIEEHFLRKMCQSREEMESRDIVEN